MKQQALLILAFVTYILCGFQSVDAATTFSRKIVMEEGTGTWCGWCVRGIETIERMKQSYPDHFIAIGLHTGDEMSGAVNYDPIIDKFDGFPECIFNRSQSGTSVVSLWSAQSAVETMKDNAIAKIEASACYSDAKLSKVSVTTTTTFGFSQTNANFRIAYVVLEDKVGPYKQYNYYSGESYSSTDYMYEWTQEESPVKVVFNDVARGIYGSADGVEGSVPTNLEESKAYKYEYEFSLPTNVSNKNNIRIVTLLINGDTGEIENADETPITSEYEIQYFERKVVMEEATGTWCGWCVRGLETIERMKKEYPDNFIAIALHYSDQMANAVNYEPIQGLFSSYPSCIFDRSRNGTSDVSIYSAESMVNSKKDNAIAKISATASYDDASHSTVSIKTETTFGFRASNAKYRIAYVVLEDKVGPYSQNNSYSGGSLNSDNYMYDWSLKNSTVSLLFNDVARGIYGSAEGVEGSVPTTIEESKAYSYEYKLTLPDNIQDKNNIRIVTLLIDGETGEIENADETPVQSESTGMAQITITAAKQSTYCSDKNLDFSSWPDLKAYVATGYDKTTGTIWLTRVKDVPANTGFLLMGEPDTYDIPFKDGVSDSYYVNLFKGTLTSMKLQATDGANTNYYLSNGSYGVGFYKPSSDGVDLGANRAYLSVPTDIQPVGAAGGTETINVSSALQMTYCSNNSLDFTDWDQVKAYTATGYNYNSGTIWLTRVKKVPAGTGILIMAPEGSYPITKASVASVYANMFVGTLEGKTIQTEETIGDVDYINYYLSAGKYGVGFYKVTQAGGVSLSPNRSYLPIPKRTVAATRGISSDTERYGIRESDDVIAIRLFQGEDAQKGFELIENASSKMEKDVFYNLQGQRVNNPGKGLYIKNGIKVVIR